MNEAREKLAFDVFLSHNSKDKPAVCRLAKALQERQIRAWLDIEQLEPGSDWQKALEDGIRASKTAAVLVGKDGLGPWQVEEMKAILQSAARRRKKLIPVLLPGASRRPRLPLFVRNRTWLDLRKGLTTEGIDKLIWGITGKNPSAESRADGQQSESASQERKTKRASKVVVAPTRLRHGAEHLVGREKELARLDAAWHDPRTHIVTIVAWGGVGKTALVVEWMARMARDGWAGAERVFDWSFYSQGTREQGAPSADTFIAAALEFFGGDEGKKLAASPASPWDKGARLAQFVAQGRTLLVLDGVEPLQYSPGPMGGRLKDPALEALFKGLAQQNPGLCIVTTRESVEDLAPFRDTTSPQWSLEHLSTDAGAELLFRMGVKRAGNAQIQPDDRELKDAARELDGHALTLQLLGRYISKAHNGDVRKRSLVRFDKADTKVQGGHAFKVMAAYENWLAEGGEDGKRQLAVLRLLGLFDRPADAGCLSALRKEPAIVGLTEPVVSLSDDDWNYTLSNLVECGLISCHENKSQVLNRRYQIDCHPLIREHFGNKLQTLSPNSWCEGHRRLCDYFNRLPAKWRPETFQEMEPLFRAVAHGCHAGEHRQVLTEVYWHRIVRERYPFHQRPLGASTEFLSCLSSFYDTPWDSLSPHLTKEDVALVLEETGHHLFVLGHSANAREILERALQTRIELGEWERAAVVARLLSELCLTAGMPKDSERFACQGVRLADQSDVPGERIMERNEKAHLLHYLGRKDEARELFEEAERIHLQYGGQALGSFAAFWYCELLLDEADNAAKSGRANWRRLGHEIRSRAEGMLRNVERIANDYQTNLYRLDRALGLLILGQVLLLESTYGSSSRPSNLPPDWDLAIDVLRQTGQQHHLANGLLVRATAHRLFGDFEKARRDLDEVWQIADRGSMRLFMADIHLSRARLFHSVTPYPWDKDEQGKSRGPKDDLAAARELIVQCGYHRRDEELADAKEAAKNW